MSCKHLLKLFHEKLSVEFVDLIGIILSLGNFVILNISDGLFSNHERNLRFYSNASAAHIL